MTLSQCDLKHAGLFLNSNIVIVTGEIDQDSKLRIQDISHPPNGICIFNDKTVDAFQMKMMRKMRYYLLISQRSSQHHQTSHQRHSVLNYVMRYCHVEWMEGVDLVKNGSLLEDVILMMQRFIQTCST